MSEPHATYEVRVWVPSIHKKVRNWYQEKVVLTPQEIEHMTIEEVGRRGVEQSKAQSMKFPSERIAYFRVVDLLALQQTGEISTAMLLEKPIWTLCDAIQLLNDSNRVLSQRDGVYGLGRILADACGFFGQKFAALEKHIVIIGFNSQESPEPKKDAAPDDEKDPEHVVQDDKGRILGVKSFHDYTYERDEERRKKRKTG